MVIGENRSTDLHSTAGNVQVFLFRINLNLKKKKSPVSSDEDLKTSV